MANTPLRQSPWEIPEEEWDRVMQVNTRGIYSCITAIPTWLAARPNADPARQIQQRILKRVEIPEDLLGTLLYLASPASAFLTGQTIVVDGGSYLH